MGDYRPAHWEQLYLEGRTPWDAGGCPEELEYYLEGVTATGRALVPGCGWGYEAARLAAAGYDVLAVDFSPAAVRRARRLSARRGVTILEADFFLLQESDFDCIYERAFMCALPPSSRRPWAERCAELLRPGGVMIGLFFLDPELTAGVRRQGTLAGLATEIGWSAHRLTGRPWATILGVLPRRPADETIPSDPRPLNSGLRPARPAVSPRPGSRRSGERASHFRRGGCRWDRSRGTRLPGWPGGRGGPGRQADGRGRAR